MTLITLSGTLALATALLFGARFVMRKQVTAFELFTVVGGHFVHGLAMVYMALVMLGMSPFLGWDYLTYFFVFFALVFVLRFILVFRVEVLGKQSVFGFEQKSKSWWEILHIANHLSMAYMFLNMAYWNEVITIYAIGSCSALLILGVSNAETHLRSKEISNRAYALFGDVGHVTMALSMIIMFGVMQWNLEAMSGSGHHHNHASLVSEAGSTDLDIVSQIQRDYGSPQSPVEVVNVATSGNWALVLCRECKLQGVALFRKGDLGWHLEICGAYLDSVERLLAYGVPKEDATTIVTEFKSTEEVGNAISSLGGESDHAHHQ
jgi:hypothetical protein